MQELLKRVNEAYDYLVKLCDIKPETGIILGTGLEDLVKHIDIKKSVEYSDIPHFPLSTVEFHSGRLLFGKLSGKEIIAMQGRFHFYEGYSMQEITFPVRVMKLIGVKNLIISNACGSMNPDMPKGSLMLIDDHINLLGANPLIGINHPMFGKRFPDMSEPYSKRLMLLIEQIAKKNDIKLHKGVYAAMSGPSLETRAEYRFLRLIGADVVGMSTVPEAIVAVQAGMQVLGISIITDNCDPDNLKPVTIDEILAAAAEAEPKLTLLISELLRII